MGRCPDLPAILACDREQTLRSASVVEPERLRLELARPDGESQLVIARLQADTLNRPDPYGLDDHVPVAVAWRKPDGVCENRRY
jgi:hypothetical protein